MRAFISYSHDDRRHGAQAKTVLEEVSIEAFLAHEDLEVSEEWRTRILAELQECDIFVPILSESFLASKWAPQEAGYIASRPSVIIAPVSIDETTSPGFLSHVQSRRIPKGGITRELLVEPLARHRPREILPRLIDFLAKAGSYRGAEARMKPLRPFFPTLTPEEAQALAAASVENGQIWLAGQCRHEFLPAFLEQQGENIEQGTRRALEHQLEHGEWYPRSEGTGSR